MSELPPEMFQRWYHSYEEDTDEEEIYRPAGFVFPRSRGPRASLEIRPDGTLVDYRPGPADRPEPVPGQWEAADGDKLRVSTGAASRTLEIVSHDPTVLKIRK